VPLYERGCHEVTGDFLFSLFKGRYGAAERDFILSVASDITPQPSAAPQPLCPNGHFPLKGANKRSTTSFQ